MSVLGIDTSTKTTEQLQAELAARTDFAVNGLLRQMLSTFNKVYNDIWNNRDGLTQQQAVDAFGTKAARLFQLSAVLQDTINLAQPGAAPQITPQAPTLNPDGTVTLTPRQ